METIGKIWKNKWFRFGAVTVLYVLWFVVWAQNLWMLLGVAVIYDIFISKYMYRLFWKRHQERKRESKAYKTTWEWIETIIFAVVVASIIRVFIFSMYVIPSSSMEKSLLIGDFLYVSKTAYGPQMPNTPLSFPLVHNLMPFSKTKKSFVDWWQRPSKRLKGLGSVKRGDAVVFNFPEGDTVMMMYPQDSYYNLLRYYNASYGEEEGRKMMWQQSEMVYRPVDKRDNYIKRCVAIAGDSLQVVKGDVYVNGVKQEEIPGKQYNYFVTTNGTPISEHAFDQMDISPNDIKYNQTSRTYTVPLTEENAKRIEGMSNITSIIRSAYYGADPIIFPHDNARYPWNLDNFGPVWVPKKGATVQLSLQNLPLYRRIIETYEGNELKVADSTIYINGQTAGEYTFKMDYYFMMGDNRHNSADSRMWGFAPEDHIVGKASFVWFSTDKHKSGFSKIRWKRLFTKVK